MRILTIGDYFEERFDSKAMGSVYSIIGAIAMMAFIGLGLSAMTKTIVAIMPKDAVEFSLVEQATYEQAYSKELNRTQAVGMPVEVLSLAELKEREQLQAMPARNNRRAWMFSPSCARPLSFPISRRTC